MDEPPIAVFRTSRAQRVILMVLLIPVAVIGVILFAANIGGAVAAASFGPIVRLILSISLMLAVVPLVIARRFGIMLYPNVIELQELGKAVRLRRDEIVGWRETYERNERAISIVGHKDRIYLPSDFATIPASCPGCAIYPRSNDPVAVAAPRR